MKHDPIPIFINGRFLAQSLAGVQRYATEMTRALLELHPERITVLAPPDAAVADLSAVKVGRMTGQLWEQFELPWHARHGVLINLGNTAPALKRQQTVVLHDAGVFSTSEAYSRSFRTWYKVLHTILGHNGTRIVTVSAFSKLELVKHLRIRGDRISIVSEGADHMLGVNPEPDILREHKLTPLNYVLVVGTLAYHKNLGALELLADHLTARGIVLAVTGAFGAAAFQAGGHTRLPAKARYLGRVSDGALRTLYENAACFVFPSRYEGFGLPAVEAMACGCPVVAADIPALRECCGDAAIYCDPGSPENISNVVLELLADPEKLARHRDLAKTQAATFAWKTAAVKFINSIGVMADR